MVFSLTPAPTPRGKMSHHIIPSQALPQDSISKCFVEDSKSTGGSPGMKFHQVLVKHVDPNPCLQAEVKLVGWLSGLPQRRAQKQLQQCHAGGPGGLHEGVRLSKHEEVLLWL